MPEVEIKAEVVNVGRVPGDVLVCQTLRDKGLEHIAAEEIRAVGVGVAFQILVALHRFVVAQPSPRGT